MSDTMILTILRTVSNIFMYLSLLFSICTTSQDTGSSQNVIILAKGEPLTVVVAPCVIIAQEVCFANRFLILIKTYFTLNSYNL